MYLTLTARYDSFRVPGADIDPGQIAADSRT
jgi:hypothetical protein